MTNAQKFQGPQTLETLTEQQILDLCYRICVASEGLPDVMYMPWLGYLQFWLTSRAQYRLKPVAVADVEELQRDIQEI